MGCDINGHQICALVIRARKPDRIHDNSSCKNEPTPKGYYCSILKNIFFWLVGRVGGGSYITLTYKEWLNFAHGARDSQSVCVSIKTRAPICIKIDNFFNPHHLKPEEFTCYVLGRRGVETGYPPFPVPIVLTLCNTTVAHVNFLD